MNINRVHMFQFPSNGKAFPNKNEKGTNISFINVSIPFKRESVSKLYGDYVHWSEVAVSFNSLQTGKRFQTLLSVVTGPEDQQSFNSLQTGKRFQTNDRIERWWGGQSFNSLQTGKRFQTRTGSLNGKCLDFVSIPFKRESVSKRTRCQHRLHLCIEFQFPSNGKAFPNKRIVLFAPVTIKSFNSLQTGKRFQTDWRSGFSSDDEKVSIPFKRESVSKRKE